MPRRRLPLILLPLLALASCGEERSPTAPDRLAGDVVETASVTRVVDSLADPGDGVCDARQCTLREAIKAPGTTTVTFASSLTGPITLAAPGSGGGPLAITTSLTISGPSAGLTIRRRSTDPVFRILRVGEGTTVTLTNLTLRNGNSDLQGGGIINLGRLTLVNCKVTGNASAKTGGGILNRGPLTLRHSTVSDNSARFGGGIDNVDAPIVATNSVIAHNATGGITNRGGTLRAHGYHGPRQRGRGIVDDRSTSTLDRENHREIRRRLCPPSRHDHDQEQHDRRQHRGGRGRHPQRRRRRPHGHENHDCRQCGNRSRGRNPQSR